MTNIGSAYARHSGASDCQHMAIPEGYALLYICLTNVRPRDRAICERLLDATGNPMILPREDVAELGDCRKREWRGEITWNALKRTRLYAALLARHGIRRRDLRA